MKPEEFKDIRIKLGKSQPQFADMLGYNSKQPIMRKEFGRVPITRQDEIIIDYILKENNKTA